MDAFENAFKSETRSSGRKLYGDVRISSPSDLQIQGYVKADRVSLKTESFESPLIQSSCSCAAGKKEQLCKHVWALILKIDDERPEFFEGKTDIEASTAKSTDSKKTTPVSEARLASEAAFKERQVDYRKLQYQKQKQRLLKNKKAKEKPAPAVAEFPDDVQLAFDYFEKNGFPIEEPFKTESVNLAKKKLSRIFHPDIGGSHEEIVELNENCRVLLAYIAGI